MQGLRHDSRPAASTPNSNSEQDNTSAFAPLFIMSRRYMIHSRKPLPRRLINVQTLELCEFSAGSEIPRYHILSHRWFDGEEPTLQAWKAGEQNSRGATKIKSLCQHIMRDGWSNTLKTNPWIWVDTVCIDKTSSAELSEAINAMASYYESAVTCIVYLADVRSSVRSDYMAELRDSDWFYRGWTLQELLFPRKLLFHNQDWSCLLRMDDEDNRESVEARELISSVTGIHQSCLGGNIANVMQQSVATRMSWAAYRRTTRIEDEAYSMLGLFNINMPLLYGEGARAFIRLQKEIMNSTSDETLFAWTMPMEYEWDVPVLVSRHWQDHLEPVPLLADHPGRFVKSAKIFPRQTTNNKPYTLTNRGLQIERPAIEMDIGGQTLLVMQLNCAGVFETSPLEIGEEDDRLAQRTESCYIILKWTQDLRLIRCMPWRLSWAYTGKSGTIKRWIDPNIFHILTDDDLAIANSDSSYIKEYWDDTLLKRYLDTMDIANDTARGELLVARQEEATKRQMALGSLQDELEYQPTSRAAND